MTPRPEVIDTSDDDLETCNVCGCKCESTDGGMCEACATLADRDHELEASQDELAEAQEELDGLLEDLAELKDRIREARSRVKEAKIAVRTLS